MPIPELNDFGLLPVGEYVCTTEEIRFAFGDIFDKEHRQRFCDELEDLISEILPLNIAIELIINGSFTTSKERPEDIDVFLVIKDDVSTLEAARLLAGVLGTSEDNTMGVPHNLYPNMHFFFGWKSSLAFENITGIFRLIRGSERRRKGLLKVSL